MKVLHVLDRSLPVVAGYTARARGLLEGQVAAGLEPLVVTGLRQPVDGAPCEAVAGIPHFRTPGPRLPAALRAAPLLREGLEMAALARRIEELSGEVRPDLIHAHSPVLCGVPAHAAARRLGLPSVYEVRAFWEDAAAHQGRDADRSARYTAIRVAETALAQRADAVVAICQGIRRDLLARGVPGERLFVVPNGVEARRFAPRPRDEAVADRFGMRGKTVVAYVGTLFRFEGVPLLLEALGRLLARRDDVRGLIVGHGEGEAEARAAHARLGLGDRVRLTGKVAPAEVPALYALADVLCYPRERHRITELTTPLKPLEAMAMGKAVVASDVGGLMELVSDGRTALSFHAGDVEDLAGTLGRLVDDPALRRRLGEQAREEVVRTRDWSTVARGYVEVYAAAAEHAMRRGGARGGTAAGVRLEGRGAERRCATTR